jgi:hypothetical protein
MKAKLVSLSLLFATLITSNIRAADDLAESGAEQEMLAHEDVGLFETTYLFIKTLQIKGTGVVDRVEGSPVAANGKNPKILLALDLDETLTDVAYAGEGRKNGSIHLKEGMVDMLHSAIYNGHPVVVITANVRAEVESFLMEKIYGIEYFYNRNTEKWDMTRVKQFRQLIMIKQPGLRGLHFFEPWKPSKGEMLQEALLAYDARGVNVDGVIFCDDKTGFHEQVLKRFYDVKGRMIPVLGLRVGHRLHYYGDPLGAHEEEKSGKYVAAGTSVDFAKLVKFLSGKTGEGSLLHLLTEAGVSPYLLNDDAIKSLNVKWKIAERVFPEQRNESLRRDVVFEMLRPLGVVATVVGQAGALHKPTGLMERFKESVGYKMSRQFDEDQSPELPKFYRLNPEEIPAFLERR